MVKRSAPATGYDFGNKRQYRRQVWATIRRAIWPKDAHILLMPSTEGDEIKEAIGRGFREDHIHAVDRNPALLATANWRS